MKYLGLDYGTKNIGIAISDYDGVMAFPRVVLHSTDNLIDEILDLCEDENIGTVVVGESKKLDGTRNVLMDYVDDFIEMWEERTELPIVLEPEFLTSHQAQHIQGVNKMIDASAATIILQSYLDKQKD